MIDIKHPRNHERTIFFMGVFLLSFSAVLYLLQDYLSTIITAGIFSITLLPFFRFLKSKLRLADTIISSLVVMIVLVLVILPLYSIFNHLLQELTRLSADIVVDKNILTHTIQDTLKTFNSFVDKTPFNLRMTSGDVDDAVANVSKNISTYFLSNVVKVGGASIQYIADVFIFLFLTVILIPALPNLRKYITSISPLHDDIDNMYINRIAALTISLMKSFFIIAVAQGILGGIFLYIAGFPYVLTFTIILMFASLVPYVGTNLVIIPIAGYMLIQGDVAAAAIILIGQVFFVTNIDNLLAAAILSHDTRLHPAIMLLAIIGGLSVFGLAGILFGPMILILFLTSLEIYMKHYKY
jgi:predicted PurR-regulated permease PerM